MTPARAPLRVAMAGAGMVSRHHLLAWQRLADAQVVAIADPDAVHAQARATEFGLPRIYEDTAQMLDTEQPDVLDIVAPMGVHRELIELAAVRGVDVICQKPLGPTLADARASAALADGRIRMMVHENWRFRPHYRQIADWLAQRCIGTVQMFRLETLSSALLTQPGGGYPPGLVRQPFMADMDKLLVLELLVHHLDLIGFLLGPLQISAASLARLSGHVRGEDTAAITLAAGSTNGVLFASMAASGAPVQGLDALWLLGTDGSIRLEGSSLNLTGKHTSSIAFDQAEHYQQAYDATVQHFSACLRDGNEFETPASVHLTALSAVEKIYQLAEWPVRRPDHCARG